MLLIWVADDETWRLRFGAVLELFRAMEEGGFEAINRGQQWLDTLHGMINLGMPPGTDRTCALDNWARVQAYYYGLQDGVQYGLIPKGWGSVDTSVD